MLDLIQNIFASFTSVISGLTGGIKSAFSHFIYEDPAAETLQVSGIAQFIFIMLGVSMAIGLVYFIMRLVKKH